MFILIVRSRPGACVVLPCLVPLYFPSPLASKGGTQNNMTNFESIEKKMLLQCYDNEVPPLFLCRGDAELKRGEGTESNSRHLATE